MNPYPPFPGYHGGRTLREASLLEADFLAQHGNQAALEKLAQVRKMEGPQPPAEQRASEDDFQQVSWWRWWLSYFLPDDWVLPRGYYD